MSTLTTNILNAMQKAVVLDIGDLRSRMPATQQGAAFDAAVLALADARQIVLAQDAMPESFSQAQLRNYIRSGCELYTCAMLAR